MPTDEFTRTDARRPEVVAATINELLDRPIGGQLIDDIATLRALDGSDDVKSAVLGGFSSLMDGGEGTFAWTTDTTTPDDGGTVIAKVSGRIGAWKRIYSGPLNVKWFGVKGDGITSDNVAIEAVVTAALALDRAVFLPAGTYLLTTGAYYLDKSGIRLIGEPGTVITRSGAANGLNFLLCNDIHIEGITFDGGAVGGTAPLLLHNSHNVNIVDCNFAPIVGVSRGISALGTTEVKIERCKFLLNGAVSTTIGPGSGMILSEGCRDWVIRGCRFEGLYGGINGTNGDVPFGSPSVENIQENITVEDCYFDGHWWTMSTLLNGSNQALTGAATYTDTSLTTTSGPALPALEQFSRVRLVHNVAEGTATANNEQLLDVSGSFLTSGLVQGDIVRMGTMTGIVLGIVDDTTLQIEKWFTTATMETIAPPSVSAFAPTAYTAYKVYIGTVDTNTSNTISLFDRWFDMSGNTITDDVLDVIDPGDISYEIVPKLNYSGVSFDSGSRRIRVVNNTVLRTHSDSISLYGNDNVVIGNYVSNGSDTGITINGAQPQFDYSSSPDVLTGNGGKTIIANNRVDHMGIEGTFCTADDAVIQGNVFTRTGWVNDGFVFTCDIVFAGVGTLCDNNICDGMNAPGSKGGIFAGSAVRCKVSNNTVRRHTNPVAGLEDDPWGIMLGDYPPQPGMPHNSNIIENNNIMEEVRAIQNDIQAGDFVAPGSAYIMAVEAFNGAPTITATGTPTLGDWSRFRVEITTGGTGTTAIYRWSSDNGYSWTSSVTADTSPQALGGTGVSIAFAVGTYVAMSEDFSTGHHWRFHAINGLDDVYINNRGFKTSANGTATILNTATSVVVTHGLDRVLGPENFRVTALEASTNDFGYLYVDTVTSTQFTIHCTADPGASNLDVGWSYAEQLPY